MRLRSLITLVAILAFVFAIAPGFSEMPMGSAHSSEMAKTFKPDCKCNKGACQADCAAKGTCASCASVLAVAGLFEFTAIEVSIAHKIAPSPWAESLAAPPLFRPPRA